SVMQNCSLSRCLLEGQDLHLTAHQENGAQVPARAGVRETCARSLCACLVRRASSLPYLSKPGQERALSLAAASTPSPLEPTAPPCSTMFHHASPLLHHVQAGPCYASSKLSWPACDNPLGGRLLWHQGALGSQELNSGQHDAYAEALLPATASASRWMPAHQ